MRLYAGGRTSRSKPTIICFPSRSGSPSCLVTRDQVERVRGPLSRGVILFIAQPLFSPLQKDLRFFHPPIPAGPSACLTARFPKGRPTGLPRSVPVPSAWFRFRLSAGGTSSAIGELGTPIPDPLPSSLSARETGQHLWLVAHYDVYTCTCAASAGVSGLHLLTLPCYPSPRLLWC